MGTIGNKITISATTEELELIRLLVNRLMKGIDSNQPMLDDINDFYKIIQDDIIENGETIQIMFNSMIVTSLSQEAGRYKAIIDRLVNQLADMKRQLGQFQ